MHIAILIYKSGGPIVGNKDEGKIMGMAGHGVYNERLYKGFKSLLSYNKGYLTFSPNSHDYIYEWFFKISISPKYES